MSGVDPAWGVVLRSRRLSMGLTLKDVEHRSGVTYAYISEVELARKNLQQAGVANVSVDIGDAAQG